MESVGKKGYFVTKPWCVISWCFVWWMFAGNGIEGEEDIPMTTMSLFEQSLDDYIFGKAQEDIGLT
jgi:hypothetical protein